MIRRHDRCLRTTVPCRPRRQPAPPREPARRPRPVRRRGDRRSRAPRDRGRGDRRRRAHAGRHRAADDDRRGVQRRLLAHGLHLRDRRHLEGDRREHRRALPERRRDHRLTPAGVHVYGPLSIDEQEPIFGRDFGYLQSVVGEGQTAKLTTPSPSMVHYRGGAAAIDPAVYPDEDAFWEALSAAYASQVRGIAAQGCTYLQFDDTSLAYLNDPAQRAELAAQGRDAEHLHERYIRQINKALAGRPDGLTVTTHMCRGNFRSSWVAGGGYDFVAEALFGGLEVDGFFLEYDDARSGGFEPLRFVPKGKRVVLGLVTTKRPQLESKDDLKRRIDEASRFVPLEQLALSGQCGFSSTVEGNALTRDEQIAKLALIVETAEEVWG